MPWYKYKCKACEMSVQIFHLMSEEAADECTHCGQEGHLEKCLNMDFMTVVEDKEKPGAVVDKFIEESKKELSNEKEKLKNRKLN